MDHRPEEKKTFDFHGTERKMHLFLRKGIKYVHSIPRFLEIVICLIVMVGVLCALPDLLSYIHILAFQDHTKNYGTIADFLRHALLIVVGIELIIMLLNHSHRALLSLTLFVIARKLLVYAEGMTDLLIGSFAILLIFFVMKYLSPKEHLLSESEHLYSASLPLTQVRRLGYILHAPAEIHTLGGLVYHLCHEQGVKIQNYEVVSDEANIYVLSHVENGVILQVEIQSVH